MSNCKENPLYVSKNCEIRIIKLPGMQAEIISIGEELLIGQTINSNAAFIASELNLIGIAVRQTTVITDNKQEIIRALQEAGGRSGVVLTTGGLGPTRDDITKEAFCDFFQCSLVHNETILQDIAAFFEKKGLPLTNLNRMQARLPAKAEALRNPFGTAPGLWFNENGLIVIAMPGVPHEMKHIMSEYVIPRLQLHGRGMSILHHTILTQGIGESFLADKISHWEESLPPEINLAYLPQPGIVRLRLTARSESSDRCRQLIQEESAKLSKIIPEYIWGTGNQTLEEILGHALRKNNQTLAVAESCTGGYLSHRITSIPGSSEYFSGGMIVYANHLKAQLPGFDPGLISAHGAVSRQVAESLAEGIRLLSGSTYGIGITGIAGPGGGSDEKPVGTVWIGICGPGLLASELYHFGDTRERNIIRAAQSAMVLLLKYQTGLLSAWPKHTI